MDEVYYSKPPRTCRPVRESIFTKVYHAIDTRGGAATAGEIATIVVRSGINDPHTGTTYERDEVGKCIAYMVQKGRLLEV